MDKGRQLVKVRDPYHDVEVWYDAGQGAVVPTEERLITMKVKNVPIEYPTDQVPAGDGMEATVLATSRISEDVSLKDVIRAKEPPFVIDEPMYENHRNCETCDDACCDICEDAYHNHSMPIPPTHPMSAQDIEKCKAKKVAYYCSAAYSPTASFNSYGCNGDIIDDPRVVQDLRNYHQAIVGVIGPTSRASLAEAVGDEPMLDMIDTLPDRAGLVEDIVERFGRNMASAMRNVIAPIMEYNAQVAVYHGERAARRVMMTRAVDQR